MDELLYAIQEYKRLRLMSDAAFCRRLGIDEGLWSRIKLGKRQPSYTLVKAIAQAAPELGIAVLDYLRGR